MGLSEQVRQAGVVGAGGAGFPTHVKTASCAEWLLANGAECEPLLYKDRELLKNFASEVLTGLRLTAAAVGASKRSIGVKSKNHEAIEALRRAGCGTDISLSEFGDFYPSGDEYEVVHTITGRLIPPAGIPLDVGVVVTNVETIYNVQRAEQGEPVTDTFLTVGGLVRKPLTTRVPVGMRFRDVLELAGGPTVREFAVMDSGLMMGRRIHDLEQGVAKTTAGLIVLPRGHNLIRRYDTSATAQARIGKSACDQCSYCTELCPRYLLGYDVQPHAVMRSLGFSATGSEIWNRYASLCCGCGICTLYACPESLYPREACLQGMADLREAGRPKWEGSRAVRVHPMKEYRRVPMKLLMKKLGVEDLDAEAPWREVDARPNVVRVALKQHTGVASRPVVSPGDRVRRGQLLGEIPGNQLGARVHASIDGRVTRVEDYVEIERQSS
jgi:Na+-translocating ferredoxin:NAD+ oxidoreductase RnfC subunit